MRDSDVLDGCRQMGQEVFFAGIDLPEHENCLIATGDEVVAFSPISNRIYLVKEANFLPSSDHLMLWTADRCQWYLRGWNGIAFEEEEAP